MRRTSLISALLFFAFAGCQYEADLPEEELGQTELQSIGGIAAEGQARYEAVAAITILLPPTNTSSILRTDERLCSGVLIEDKTVLTSARCLSNNVEAELDDEYDDSLNFLDDASIKIQFGSSSSEGTEFHLDSSFDDGINTHKGVTLHRYYTFGTRGVFDVALLRLSDSPGIAPVTIHTTQLEQSLVGQPLELVGYGSGDNDADPAAFSVRKVVDPVILTINPEDIKAGDDDKNTCYADAGGPGFLTFGGEAELVSVNGLPQNNTDCTAKPNRQRIDKFAELFLTPYINRFENPCVGAACDNCEYDGVCKEDCPTRDWDCELGSMTGEECENNGDCEEGGHCAVSADDPSFSYCVKSCIPDERNTCPSSMVCDSNSECVYDGPSPGSQGAACATPADCRSGFCESLFCATACDPAAVDACQTDDGFFCLPATDDASVNVCRLDFGSGGGGFCSASPETSNRNRNTFLSCFGFLFLMGMMRRRRQND